MTDLGSEGFYKINIMSSKSHKAEYQTSVTANRIVKDLVREKLPKGETFDPVRALQFNPMLWV